MLFRSPPPPIASVAVGTVTAILTEKVAGKVVDKVVDKAASKTIETAKDAALSFMTGDNDHSFKNNETKKSEEQHKSDIEMKNDGTLNELHSSPIHRNSLHMDPHTSSSPAHGQKRTLTTKATTRITPQRQEQPYDYIPTNKLDQLSNDDKRKSILNNMGQEATMKGNKEHAVNESAPERSVERLQKAAERNPTDTDEIIRAKDDVKGFAQSVVGDHVEMWQELKHEWNEVMDTAKSSLQDAQAAASDKVEGVVQAAKETAGAVLGAGMGDARKAGDAVKRSATSVGQVANEIADNMPSSVKDTISSGQSELGSKNNSSYPSGSEIKQGGNRILNQANAASKDIADKYVNKAYGTVDRTRIAAHEAADKVGELSGRMKKTTRKATDSVQDTAQAVKGQVQNSTNSVKTKGSKMIKNAKQKLTPNNYVEGNDDKYMDTMGMSVNDLMDEAEDKIRGGDVRKSKL